MKTYRYVWNLVAALMLSALTVMAAEEPPLFDSLKLGDITVKNVRVKEATPTHLTLLYDGGGTRLKRQDAPPELRKLYPYDAKEAADYEKEQADLQAQRAQDVRVQQQQNAQQLKVVLLQQKTATEQRIEDLQKQLVALEKEMGPMRAKAAGKPRSPARMELNAARDRKQNLIHRVGEQKKQLDAINKNLDRLP